jgi:RNA polymerase sigma factor (sigma-70 family)
MKNMLYEDNEFCDLLMRIIQKLTPDHELQKDLMQEALIHVCSMESDNPGQTKSWYAQSCIYHLQHYLNQGSSIDSYQRRRAQIIPEQPTANGDAQGLTQTQVEQFGVDDEFLSRMCADEIVRILLLALSKSDKLILELRLAGMGTNEIARQIGSSHKFVMRHRETIKSLAIHFGLAREISRLEVQHRKVGSPGRN